MAQESQRGARRARKAVVAMMEMEINTHLGDTFPRHLTTSMIAGKGQEVTIPMKVIMITVSRKKQPKRRNSSPPSDIEENMRDDPGLKKPWPKPVASAARTSSDLSDLGDVSLLERQFIAVKEAMQAQAELITAKYAGISADDGGRDNPPKEAEKFVPPAMPTAGRFRSYCFAVRTKVISGVPSMADEFAVW